MKMPLPEVDYSLKADSLSTARQVCDTFTLGLKIYFDRTAAMIRNGLKYLLLAGTAVPHVLSTTLQPTPPMGKVPPVQTPNSELTYFRIQRLVRTNVRTQ
jgi:hypothetical protein